MAALKTLILLALVGYLGLVAILYVAQRALMYVPETARTPPAAAGVPAAEEVVLDTADGEKLIAWYVPPRGDKPIVLYFHGNGGSLRLRGWRFRDLTSDGTGLLAVSYRGYGGSTGSPTEAGFLQDARAAYDFAAARHPADRIALWGESLGTGVAVALAAERPVARVVLESPFTSTADVAATIYFFVPVRLMMKDQFRSDERIGAVTAPVLVLHGERDNVVPICFGERLYDMIRAPKRFVRLPRASHNDHDEYGAVELVRKFLSEPMTSGRE